MPNAQDGSHDSICFCEMWFNFLFWETEMSHMSVLSSACIERKQQQINTSNESDVLLLLMLLTSVDDAVLMHES